MSSLVSVVIPYYEMPEYLPEAVRSALAQDYRFIEIIVVDDGSRMHPPAAVLQLAGLEVSAIITLAENRGIGAARNAGIRQSKGEFIVTLDCDDIIQPEFISATMAAARGNQYGGAYTQVRHFGSEELVISHDLTLPNLLSRQGAVSALLFRRELFDSVGGYKEDKLLSEDYQFLIDAISKGWQFCRVEKPLYWYRKHAKGASLTATDQRMPLQIDYNRDLYRENFEEVIVGQENKYLSILEEYKAVLSTLKEAEAQLHESSRQREIDAGHIFSLQASIRKGNLDRELLSDMLYYSDFRSKTIAELATRIISSQSWRATESLRKTKVLLRKLKSVSRDFSAPTVFCQGSEMIAASGLFDENYYLTQCQLKSIEVQDPIRHFVQGGWRLGLNPNHFFDSKFYADQLLALDKVTSHDPLVHYLLEGAEMGLPTSRLFDSAWYVNAYPDVHESGMNPLAHFIRFGLFEGRLPIDVGRYRSTQVATKVVKSSSAKNISQIKRLASDRNRTYDMVLAVHQASRTGAPMLGLAIVKGFVERGYNCLAVLLEDGELADEFAACADVLSLAGLENPAIKLDDELELLIGAGKLKPQSRVFLNSAGLHELHGTFKKHGLQVISLIQEFLSAYPPAVRERIMESSDLAVFSAQATMEDARRSCQTLRQSYVLPQGLLEPGFGSMSRLHGKEFLHSKYGIPSSSFVVLACGTADQRKGIDIFAQVARRILKEESNKPDMHFIWIGENNSGDIYPTLWAKADVEQSGIGKFVHFVGEQSDIEPFFAGADMFLLPSRQDPLPCVLHLAMASALPVAAFLNSGGATEVLANGGGKLVSYGSVSAMADVVMEYYANDELRNADGRTGQLIVSSKYRMSDYLDNLLELDAANTKDGVSAYQLTPSAVASQIKV